jgi:hypothetical protein
MKTTFIAASAFVCSAFAFAGTEIVIDGSAEKGYGSAVAVQGIATSFGDHLGSSPGICDGSELDVAYGVVVGDAATGHLHLVLSGNLQTNFNKINVFVDARAGAGQNSLRNNNPDVDFNRLNTAMGASADGSQPGLTFDAGFDADALVMVTVGGGAPNTMFVNYSQLLTEGGGSGGFAGQGNYDNLVAAHVMPPRAIGPAGSGWQLSAALNNTNVAGVTGGNGEKSSGAGVTTGLELKISLAALNWDGTSPVKVCAFVTNDGHNFASNQVLGGLPVGTGNLGVTFGGRPDFSAIDGNQFLICPSSSGPVSIVVDGDAEPAYGAPLAVQGITTGFGDHVGAPPPPGDCYGSELDAAYGVIVGDAATGHLHLVLAGNLQSNFNKLDIFFDARPGAGQNSLLGNNPDLDFNNLNNSMGAFTDPINGPQPGLTFDAGFDADAVMFFTLGGGAPNTMYVNYGQLLTEGGGAGGYVGQGNFEPSISAHVLPPTDVGGGSGLFVTAALNNTNIAGVEGGVDGQASSGAGVVTGLELRIPLAAINWDGTSDIKVCAFITNGGHDFMSNQVLGGLPVGSPSIGTGRPNFALIDGNQYFVISPGSSPDTCPADLTDDGFVDGNDLGVLLGAWGDCPTKGACPADLNDDAFVDGNDLGLLLAAWGTCPR